MNLRAFLALDIDDEARERLAAFIETLRPELPGVRFVRAEGLHVTLRFLGWADPGVVQRVGDRVAPAAAACAGADLPLSGVGLFPERGSPRVLWVGLALTDGMHQLQRACEEAARAEGFEPEARPFSAHLTLGRWSDGARRPLLPPVSLGSTRVDRLVLYRSEPGRSGAVYTPLRAYDLRLLLGRTRMPELATRSAVLIGAYLLGSVPFSYLVARGRGVDVRRVGSGNVGATNVMRNVSVAAGLLAFLLDAFKGALAVVLARLVEPTGPLPVMSGVMAVLGHMYSVWLRFRGGKGVATGAGAFLPLAPMATAGALIAFALGLAITRYVSLSSIIGTVTLALLAFLGGSPPLVSRSAAGLAVLITWKHRANLQRIARGTENRMGRRAPAAPPTAGAPEP